VLGSVISIQLGAAWATSLFDTVGPAGTVFYRVLLAAILLMAIWRPQPAAAERGDLILAAAFGVCLAAMNLCFYEAIDRIPLGIAVTCEFVGPLAVALGSSRRALDLLWVALAAAGILMLIRPSGSSDAAGIALALTAGAFWGAYIPLAARIGRAFSGGRGLALAMVVAAAVLSVPGIAAGGADLLGGEVIAIGVGVAVLTSVVPYSLELEALRRLPVGTFGVLMSLEPAAAAAIGFIALGQDLAAIDVLGIALVIVASAGALRESRAGAPTEA
jgi:inner membrane transporter RhtA